MVKNLGLPILGKLVCLWRKVDTRVFYLQPKTIIMTFVLLWYNIVMCWTVLPLRDFCNLCQNCLLNARKCLGNFSFCQKFLTRNSLFLLETRLSYSKLTFLTRNSLFLLETHFSYSKLTFITRNSLFLLETRFSYSKLTFLTRNSLLLLETHFSGNTLFDSFYLTMDIQNIATLATGKFSGS